MNLEKWQERQTMTSLEIAKFTGKKHHNLLRDIREMQPAWEEINELKFELVNYKGNSDPCTI